MKIVGNVLILGGIIILLLIFWPVGKQEIKYTLDKIANVQYSVDTKEEGTFEKPLVLPNTDFSIAIPKIGAVAPVIANVDSQNKLEYLKALKKGVAHAKGTKFPGENGNVYIFAHSTDAFYNIGSYNAVFFLLGKLNTGDEIDIYYRDILYKYEVYDKKVVSPDSSQYFGTIGDGKTLTLQTCYPPGTTIDRLIVLAKEINPQ